MAQVHNPTDNVIKFYYDNGLGPTPAACLPGQTIEVAHAEIEDATGLLEITMEEDQELIVVDKPPKREEPDFEDIKARSSRNTKRNTAKRDPRQSDPRS